MLKKLLAMVLVIGLLGTSAAFAGELPKKPAGEVPKNNEALILIIETYAPEMLADYEAAFAEHESVHVSLEAVLTERMANKLEEHQIFLSEIVGKLRSGEIDKATAKQMLEAKRLEVKDLRAATKLEIQTLKESYNLSPEANKAMRASLKLAIEAEDNAQVVEILGTMYSTLLTHIQFDYAKLALIQAQ